MAERETVIIDVQFEGEETAKKLKDVQQAMRFLQNENAALKQQMKDLDRTTEEGAEAFAKLSTQYAINTQQIKSLQVSEKVLQQAEMDLGVQATITGDSFKEQARQLAVMKNAYSQMSKAERESASGQEFLKKLQQLDAQVKANDASMGNFQRNVGNYPKVFDLTNTSIGKLVAGLQGMGGQAQTVGQYFSGAFTQMTTGLKAFGKAFLTPPVAVITVVVGGIILLFEKLKEAFKKNDDAMTSLQRAMAGFQPIIDVVNKALNAMIDRIVKVVEGIGKIVAFLAEWVTGSEGAADAAMDLVTSMDELQDKEREYTVSSAKNAKEIADLRAKVAEKDKYTAKEREEMLQRAIDLEGENLAKQKEIAEQRLAIIKQEAKQRNDTSDEMKNKIAEAEAAVYEAEEQYAAGTRRLKAELSNLRSQEAKEVEQHAKAAVEAKQRQAEKEAQIARMAEDYALSQIKDEGARRIAERQIQGEREIADLQKRLETEKDLTVQARQQLADLIKSKQEDLNNEINEMAIAEAEAREQSEYDREREQAIHILELRKQLATEGSEQMLQIDQELLKQRMEAELEQEQLSAEEKELIQQTYLERSAELNQQYLDGLQATIDNARQKYEQNLRTVAQSASKAFGAMSNLLAEYGEENEEAMKASKAFAMMQILADQAMTIADTAKAITAAVAGATSAAATTGPAAPFVLGGYIAAMVGAVIGAVASVASTIAQAKQILSGADTKKFATGGVVEGDPTKIDSVPAMLTAGEVVLNADQQARLLYSLAQGNVAAGADNTEAMRAAFSEALQEMPAPTMVYQEFQEFQARTAQYNELTAL